MASVWGENCWSLCSGVLTALILFLFLYWIMAGLNYPATLGAISIPSG